MNQHLHVLYRTTLAKYTKFKTRYKKNIQSGSFYRLSSKKQKQITHRLQRLLNRLNHLKWQLKIETVRSMLPLAFLILLLISKQSRLKMRPRKSFFALSAFGKSARSCLPLSVSVTKEPVTARWLREVMGRMSLAIAATSMPRKSFPSYSTNWSY